VNKTILELHGDAGNVYITRDSDMDPFEVWFEDFCILGQGSSQLAALQDAALHVAQLALLLTVATGDVINPAHTAGGE
jgi:hypothetical protein